MLILFAMMFSAISADVLCDLSGEGLETYARKYGFYWFPPAISRRTKVVHRVAPLLSIGFACFGRLSPAGLGRLWQDARPARVFGWFPREELPRLPKVKSRGHVYPLS